MTILVVLLVCWNAFLTYKINLLERPQKTDNEAIINVVNQTVTGFSTDLTKIVEEAEAKVVGVQAFRGSLLLGSGSGAIWRSDKEEVLILTNRHILEGADTIQAVFDNGSPISAELIGSDSFSDLALLRVIPDFNVESFTAGDSSLCKNGEWLIAVGSAQTDELQGTVAVGVVSMPQHSQRVDLDNDGEADWEMLFLVTDAAINQGNTGGPLINMAGELIGISSSLFSSSQEGFSAIMPINEVNLIAEQLLENGVVLRQDIGMSVLDIQTLTVYQKSHLGLSLDTVNGLVVQSLKEDSAAEKAGIQVNDVLVSIQDTRIISMRQYRRALYQWNTQEALEIVLIRDGREMTVTVVLE